MALLISRNACLQHVRERWKAIPTGLPDGRAFGKMIARRLASDYGRNMEAQAIVPGAISNTGKRFEVVKDFS